MQCSTCRLPEALCVCALVPRLHTRTRLVLLVPHGEARKPSNTGQLAGRCLANSHVEILRKRGGPVPPPLLAADELPLVLFPAADAAPITSYAASSKPIALIVPDGSWHQARDLQARAPLRHFARLTLPPLGPSEYRLRSEPQPDGLATFEAIARALRILEGDAVSDAMLVVFRTMVERLLWFRGKLRDDEVTGGIPPSALAHDPRGAATRARATSG